MAILTNNAGVTAYPYTRKKKKENGVGPLVLPHTKINWIIDWMDLRPKQELKL